MNNLNSITCPKCQHVFEPSQALAEQLRAEIKGELSKAMDKELQARLSQEERRLKNEAAKQAKEQIELELADMKARQVEADKQLAEFRNRELEIRKEKRLLEEQKQAMSLEMARQLDRERKLIEQETTNRLLEERRLADKEKDKQLSDLKNQIDVLKHKSEIGSQQSRGEILELDLEETLRNIFAQDDITPVGKGILGADLIQHVRNRNGKLCEKIVWETKRTKHWSDQWVDKVKDDSRKMNGFVCVIVSQTLPTGVKGFDYYNGIWVCDYNSAIGLATALRIQIIHVCHVRDSLSGKDEKMTTLYNYLTSHQFRGRIEAIVETFQQMNFDLNREKEAMRRLWAKREKEINRLTENTVTMYGEMQGLVGSGLASLPTLDLLALTEGDPGETEKDQ